MSCSPVRSEFRIRYEEYILKRILYETLFAKPFDHAPGQAIYLTCRGIVDFDVVRFFYARVPACGDHQIHRYVHRYYVGRGVVIAKHSAQNSFTNCSLSVYWQ